jgi:hypothetical protein
MLCCLALLFGGTFALLRGLVASTRTLLIAAVVAAAAGAPLAAWALTMPNEGDQTRGLGPICGAHLRALEQAFGVRPGR